MNTIRILYGSETSTAEDVAHQLGDRLEDNDFDHEVIEMAEFDTAQLAELESGSVVLIVTSTHGNGHPPFNARDLHGGLHEEDAPALEHLRFAVLALGDRVFTKFCQCGKDFDARLGELGARRIHTRGECDGDPDDVFEAWSEALLPILEQIKDGEDVEHQPYLVEEGEATPERQVAAVTRIANLNGEGSEKTTLHLELRVDAPGFAYEVGDRIAVWPANLGPVVDAVLAGLGADGEAQVTFEGETRTLRETLRTQLDITRPTQALAEHLAVQNRDDEIRKAVTASPEGRAVFLSQDDVVGMLARFPCESTAPDVAVSLFEALESRLYSIASTPKVHGSSVHILAGLVEFKRGDRTCFGVCTGYFAKELREGDTLQVQISAAKHFRPPPGDAAAIMIGPGTGIAPFRGFWSDRTASGVRHKDWLFVGDRHAATDNLYGAEIDEHLADGSLAAVHYAWSRDQEAKVYVQDRLREQGAQLWALLESGAHVYVCGDAERMAPAVEAALTQIHREHGGLGDDASRTAVEALRRGNRYHLDVY